VTGTDTRTVLRSPRAKPGHASYLQQLLDASAGIAPAEATPVASDQLAAPPVTGSGSAPTGGDGDHSAAVVAAATATGTRRQGPRDTGRETGADTAACLAACADTALDPTSAQPTDWTRFGRVVPVLGGGPGAGASMLAVVLADALAATGLRVLLVDAADPLRSGLVLAAGADGPATAGPHPGVSIRHAHRGPIRVSRLEFHGLPVRSVGMVPAPTFWSPGTGDGTGTDDDPVDVTVVDVGWDAWTVAALPLHGAGGWLRTGTPAPRPVLAVRPTAPGVRAAETLLARLGPWHGHGVAPVAAAVLTGCRKPPAVAMATAGHYLEALLEHAVCLPHDAGLAERGVTDTETPPRLQHTLTPLLGALGLLGSPIAPTSRSAAARLLRRPSQHHEGNPS
jgi:hypothetical protein